MTSKSPKTFEFDRDLTIKETCETLSVSQSHVYAMIRAGTLDVFKVHGGTRIKRESLNRLRNGTPADTQSAA